VTAIQKFTTGIIAIGMVTTLVLPKRQTPQVINAGGTFVAKVLGVAMGTAKA